MSRDDDIALCFANLKGSKDKDLLGTAQALHRLKRLPEFESNTKLGATFGVSGEIIREFLALLELPADVQRYFSDGKLGLEQGRRLRQVQIARREPLLVRTVAEAMLGMNAHQSRHLVSYLLMHREATVSEAKKAIEDARTVTRKTFGIVASLSEEQFGQLKREATKRKQTVNDLVKHIVEVWLGKR